MDKSAFWDIIKKPKSGSDPEGQAEAIQERLMELPASEIVGFYRQVRERMAESYSWNLWGAAYLINGGCSDDGFDYFRAWLIAQGREVFEAALADPESLASLPGLEGDVECEDLLYAADRAYEEKEGSEMPIDPETAVRMPELGPGWDFDDENEMRKRYPKLSKKFS